MILLSFILIIIILIILSLNKHEFFDAIFLPNNISKLEKGTTQAK